MTAKQITLVEFLAQAGRHGPCIGLLRPSYASLVPPEDVELRTVDGASIRDFDTLLRVLAHAWQFPSSFRPNPNAFNDYMRDLDGMIDVAFGKPPAPGYLTEVARAHLLLPDDPETFKWLVEHVPFYRDYYRDEADPPASFGLLLSAPAANIDEVRDRWTAAGAEIATVELTSTT